MIPEAFFEEITAHLRVVEQLSVHIRADSDEAERELDLATGDFLNQVVKSIQPLVAYFDQTEFEMMTLFGKRVAGKGIELAVPEYRLFYHGDQKFNNIVVTTNGRLVTKSARWGTSDPWYFLGYVLRAAPIERLNFVIILLGSLVSFLKENWHSVEEQRQQVEEARGWLATSLQILRHQAPN